MTQIKSKPLEIKLEVKDEDKKKKSIKIRQKSVEFITLISSENDTSSNKRDAKVGMSDLKAAAIDESSSLNSNHTKGDDTQTDWLALNITHNNLKFSNLQPSNTNLDQKLESFDERSSPVDTSEKELERRNSL